MRYLALLYATLLLAPSELQAQEQAVRTINVTGTGTVSAAPDMARVIVAVETRSDTATEALKENTSRMRKVLDAIRAAQIPPKDIQTVSFTISPVTERKPDRRIIRYYHVQNSVRVTVRNLDRLGELLDAVVGAGANRVSSIQFDVSKRRELEDEARRKAVQDARRKAELLAEAAGVRVGPVLRITEGAIPEPGPIVMRAQLAAAPVPIQPGQLEITARVSVVFGIE